MKTIRIMEYLIMATIIGALLYQVNHFYPDLVNNIMQIIKG